MNAEIHINIWESIWWMCWFKLVAKMDHLIDGVIDPGGNKARQSPLSYHIQKWISTWIKGINVKIKTLKILQENLEYIYDFEVWKIFSINIANSEDMKEKTYLATEIKNFVRVINKSKRKTLALGENCNIHEEESIFTIIKGFS